MNDDIRAAAAKRREGDQHWIVSLARATAFVPMSRSILSGIGYSIVTLEEWREDARLQQHRPELCIVEEGRIDELPNDREFQSAPIIALTGRAGVTTPDSRVIGGIPAPAGLHELYRLLQQGLEAHPRGFMRVSTRIPAILRQGGEEWTAPVLSLSENGCLVRTPKELRFGSAMEIQFDLPRLGRVKTEAEPTYQLLPDTGIVFSRTAPGHRRSIQIFVEKNLVG